MRITLLTQYYPPETGAPQNRLHSLAKHLKAAGHEVSVLTAMPNYPKMRVFDGYRGRLFHQEAIDGISVRRSWIYASRSKGILPRLLNYFSFVFTSLAAGLRSPGADYLVCESPPLFLGISAFLLSRVKGARLVFNVSDLWPESAEKLGIVGNGAMLRLAYALEAWLYRRSFLVTGQTQGIVEDIRRRFPEVRTFWLPNGVDREVYAATVADSSWRAGTGLEGRKLLVYAGIVGHAQGLDVIVRAAAALRDRPDVAFAIVGDGPVKEELQRLNEQLGAGVVFVAGMPRTEVMGVVADAYACVVPLKKLDLFRGAIPSKLFDPLALGVPVLLGVDGEARELFIEQGRAGVFFEPENVDELVRAVRTLSDQPELRDRMGSSGRSFVVRHFDRTKIAASFLEQLEG